MLKKIIFFFCRPAVEKPLTVTVTEKTYQPELPFK